MRLLTVIVALPLWARSQNIADDETSATTIDEGTKLTFGLDLDFCAPDDDSPMGQVIAAKKQFWAWKLGLYGYDVYSQCSSSSEGMSIIPGPSTYTDLVTATVNPAYTVDWVTEPGEVVTAWYTPTPIVTATFQIGTETYTELSISTGTPIPYTTAYVITTQY